MARAKKAKVPEVNLDQVLEEVAKEKGIEKHALIETIEAAILKAAQNKHREQPPAPPQARKAAISSPDGAAIATVKATDKGVSLTVKTEGFDRWIEENASELMNEWFARWQSEQSE